MASPRLRANFESKLAKLLGKRKGDKEAPEEWELKLLDITGKYLARSEDDASYGGALTGLNDDRTNPKAGEDDDESDNP